MSKSQRDKGHSAWKQLADFPDYEINEFGEIRRLVDGVTRKAGHVVKGSVEQGYRKVKLSVDGVKKVTHVHRLVCQTFVSDIPFDGAICRHLDDDKMNNHYSNLSWGTHYDNHQDRKRNGNSFNGERNGRAKLTWPEVATIRKHHAETRTSIAGLSRKFDVSYSQMAEIVKNKSWVVINE